MDTTRHSSVRENREAYPTRPVSKITPRVGEGGVEEVAEEGSYVELV
uniref:Uncharacterized protein n=1 Tax=Anguilla anguilla TaxID=7936 RepID=A0A0E9PYK2_ANGAN